ncbi:MAG: type II toxin-antitoxin system RelB/DinJ family antitoxin [Cardiobacteriaceae bacterium]|nr:type II toxin-antitoxin system RelB/DinJ family antitoxin [Cardiobacteriaceae bacterium]
MTTRNFNVRIDENLGTEASKILANYGLSPAQAIKLFFNQVVATKQVPLSFDYKSAEKQPSEKLLNAIRELENGETSTYESLDDFVKAFK